MPVTQCRYFSGYKPCKKSARCDDTCSLKSIPTINVLLVHLGAIGAVIRSTALLASIHRKYPGCRLIWVTDAPSHQLLQNHPLIDRVYTTTTSDILALQVWDFEVALVVDKSQTAVGIVKSLNVDQVFGFDVDPQSGAILPATNAASELWEIGLNDEKKFFLNTKTEAQLVHEALELGPYRREPYFLQLHAHELALASDRRKQWALAEGQPVIGFNTGCSNVLPHKKWTVAYHRKVIQSLLQQGFANIVLLGGREDCERNQQIADGLPVIQSPTDYGLRDGLVSVQACDIVFSGDSAGMHLAIAAQKFVIAWFGPTCAHEIELYDSGVFLQAQVGCSPCWNKSCDKPVMCYDQVAIKDVESAFAKGLNWWGNQAAKSLKTEASKIEAALATIIEIPLE